MSFRLSLKNLLGRNPAGPTLRERAAEPDVSQTRRAIVAGSLAAAVPLPVLALAIPADLPAGPHPDQALIDAEAEYNRAALRMHRIPATTVEGLAVHTRALLRPRVE